MSWVVGSLHEDYAKCHTARFLLVAKRKGTCLYWALVWRCVKRTAWALHWGFPVLSFSNFAHMSGFYFNISVTPFPLSFAFLSRLTAPWQEGSPCYWLVTAPYCGLGRHSLVASFPFLSFLFGAFLSSPTHFLWLSFSSVVHPPNFLYLSLLFTLLLFFPTLPLFFFSLDSFPRPVSHLLWC